MRIILACLMCVVLGAAECLAISGGPVYPGGGNIVGTYAGVLQPVFDPDNPSSANSLGIFSLGVPTSSLANGAFVMFAEGRVFSGTIQGTADPEKLNVNGILHATFDYTLTTLDPSGDLITIDVTASANGRLDSKIETTGRTSSVAATRLRGTSNLSIDQGQVNPDGSPVVTSRLSLIVDGFKQSNTAPTTTAGPSG